MRHDTPADDGRFRKPAGVIEEVRKSLGFQAGTHILVGKWSGAAARATALLEFAMAQQQPIRSNTGSREIPDKLYFRIGEVAKLCEVPAYVLRFWEGEFPQLKPNKGGTGQRLYRRRDVEMALRVKTLLYDEGYTIPGARQFLKGEARSKEPSLLPGIGEAPDIGKLKQLRKEMQDLLTMLQKPAGVKSAGSVQSIRAAKVKRSVVDRMPEGLFGDAGPAPDEDF